MRDMISKLAMAALICCAAISCSQVGETREIDELPLIFPDYAGVTIPVNIAPLNFSLMEEGECALEARSGDYVYTTRGRKGLFTFTTKAWKHLVASDEISITVKAKKDGEWVSYKPFSIEVAHEPIDPWLSYRLIPPGYQGWMKMGIYQRNLESYDQFPIFENASAGGNCVNCHSYPNRNPDKMVFHARELHGGTMMIRDGHVEKLNTKTDSTISALVYPYWHPSEKYIAFSTNSTLQSFFNHNPNRIEVFDKASDVVVYDVENNCIAWSPLTKSAEMFETFPSFSPDGRWLYFCSAKAVANMPADYDKAKYGLYRIAFDPDGFSFGDSLECVYNAPAEDRSVSFPRISPDGRFLAFTLHGYGNFSIWHKDADVCILDLETGEMDHCEALNSDDVDSYHSWSGNSRWMVVSSRRVDGLFTRPYITYVDSEGKARKPFLLPQRNPLKYYKDLMFSYNIPELMEGKVETSQKSIASTMIESKGTDVTVR